MPNIKLNKYIPLIILVLFSVFLYSGCSGPKTPQELANAFWQAVIDNNSQLVAKYSTLQKPETFKEFGMDWHGYKPSWGKIVIDSHQASIETVLTGPTSSTDSTEKSNRSCVTYLVRNNNEWKVDYKLTETSLRGGALGSFIGTLNQLGTQFSKNFDSSVKQLDVELERLGRKFKNLADNFSQQATEIAKQNADNLKKIMKELEDSINQALQDDNNQLTEQDKQVMKGVASDLDASSQQLTEPSTDALTQSYSDMGKAQQHLASVDSGVNNKYRKHWQELFKQYEDNMQAVLDKLAASIKSENNIKNNVKNNAN